MLNEIWCSICCRYMDDGCKKCSHFDEQVHLDQEDKVDTSPEHLSDVDKGTGMICGEDPEEQRKKIINLGDMIEGEINRMCITDDLNELDTMALYAKKNIEKLQELRYKQMKGR